MENPGSLNSPFSRIRLSTWEWLLGLLGASGGDELTSAFSNGQKELSVA